MSTSTRQKQRNYKLNEATASTHQRQPIMLNTKDGLVELDVYVMVPAYFITHQSLLLTHIEARVMLYIFYRTLGFRDGSTGARKTWDAISHSQFLKGITTRAGRQLDMGAGVSERSLDKALDGLEEKGFIKRERIKDQHNRHRTTVYELDLKRAGAMWLKNNPASECISSLTSTRKANEDLGSTDGSSYKPAQDEVRSNATSSEVAREQPAPEISRPHFEVGQPATQARPCVHQIQTTSGETNAPGTATHAKGVTTGATTEGKGSHWHEGYVNQDKSAVRPWQAENAIPVKMQEGFPQFFGEGSRNFSGRVPAILQDTTESFNNKDSNNKNKTQQLCDAPVRKNARAINQGISSIQKQPQMWVGLEKQDFSSQANSSNQARVMSSYPSRQSITAYKPPRASDHSTRPLKAHKSSGTAKTQSLKANFELSLSAKAGEISATGQGQLEALVEEFCRAGVSYIKAYQLAEIASANGHRAGSYVGECLRYIQKQQGIKSRLGMLVYLVKTNWQPPTDQQKRFGSGLLANKSVLASKWAHLSNRASVQPQEDQAVDNTSPADFISVCEAQPRDGRIGEQCGAAQWVAAPEQFEIVPSPARCQEVWLQVCQKAVVEWGVAPELLAGSWLMPAEMASSSKDHSLLLHLSEPTTLAALRHKFCSEVRRDLELDQSWYILDAREPSLCTLAG